MSKALNLVVEGKMGNNRAALECRVPHTTLKDRIAGRVAPGCRMGKKPCLTEEEGKKLVTYVTNCAKMGTRQDVIKVVEGYMKYKSHKMSRGLTKGWWNCFIKRWPELGLRKGDSLVVVREHASSHGVLKATLTYWMMF